MDYCIERKGFYPTVKNHLLLGGDNGRDKIEVSNKYLIKNGKPWIPVMGEYHFSRDSRENWETELLKMRAGGVEIVSAYLFWIHHEQTEGDIRFDGNLDIRYFTECCFKCGMYVILRIGPWVHGEARNGGFPDWLVEKTNMYPDWQAGHDGKRARGDDPVYLKYCRGWYRAIARQLKGLMFYDGTGLVGFQIDNELQHNKKHLQTLLDIAKEEGLSAPIYTATAWGMPNDAELPEGAFLPVYGCYTEAPWAASIDKLPQNKHYFFGNIRNDHSIGADLSVAGNGQNAVDYTVYPYATCEMGGGLQATYKRRPIPSGDEIAAMAVTKLGSGNCLLGYYMYHGGKNPMGKTTMQESAECGYPNELPMIDYDYHAHIGAYGTLSEQYGLCRLTALFLKSFGENIAECFPYYQKEKITSADDTESLRYCFRDNGKSGFVFVNNYSRGYRLSRHENVRFCADGEPFPKYGLNVSDGSYGFIPYNFKMKGTVLKYSSMQPVCFAGGVYFFFSPFECRREMCFEGEILSVCGNCKHEGSLIYDICGTVTVKLKDGGEVTAAVVEKDEAQYLSVHGGQVYKSRCGLYYDGKNVIAAGNSGDDFTVYKYTGGEFLKVHEGKTAQCTQICPEELDTESFNHKLLREFDLGKTKRRLWRLKLPYDDAVLHIDMTCDIAQIYADGKLYADKFWDGTVWKVRIRGCGEVLLTASELDRRGKYLEMPGSGLCIKSIKAYTPVKEAVK